MFVGLRSSDDVLAGLAHALGVILTSFMLFALLRFPSSCHVCKLLFLPDLTFRLSTHKQSKNKKKIKFNFHGRQLFFARSKARSKEKRRRRDTKFKITKNYI